jgi:hypothetical protein
LPCFLRAIRQGGNKVLRGNASLAGKEKSYSPGRFCLIASAVIGHNPAWAQRLTTRANFEFTQEI